MPVEMCWAACSVLRGCITVWPFSKEDSWRAHGRDLVFYWAKLSPQKSHSTWAVAGRPTALSWYADFSLARRLCWAWDAKHFGQTPAPLQKSSLPASGRNMRCVPQLFPVPLACSLHCKLDARPANIYHQLPGFTRMSQISRPLKPQKETPWPPVMTKNIALDLLHIGSWPATEITQSQTQSYCSATCWFSISPGWLSAHTWSKIFWVVKKSHL